MIHGAAAKEIEIITDKTVQEKNITFLIDSILVIKFVEATWRIATQEDVCFPQSQVHTFASSTFFPTFLHFSLQP
ncbi:MAG: hypothetical protein MUF71_00720 [Candidatus Kapabacteria bacterium]|nr:hypothetical protein [Candidatus Kapabacteria bacterium]